MPRFFFHIRSVDQSLSMDEFGLDYPDVETAFCAALCAAQGLEEVFAARGEDPRGYVIEIEDGSGEVVARLPFSDIFDGHASEVGRPPQDGEGDRRRQEGAS
jgi:hypothetical protein